MEVGVPVSGMSVFHQFRPFISRARKRRSWVHGLVCRPPRKKARFKHRRLRAARVGASLLLLYRIKWQGSRDQSFDFPNGCVAGCRSVAKKSSPTYRSGDAVSFAKA